MKGSFIQSTRYTGKCTACMFPPKGRLMHWACMQVIDSLQVPLRQLMRDSEQPRQQAAPMMADQAKTAHRETSTNSFPEAFGLLDKLEALRLAQLRQATQLVAVRPAHLMYSLHCTSTLTLMYILHRKCWVASLAGRCHVCCTGPAAAEAAGMMRGWQARCGRADQGAILPPSARTHTSGNLTSSWLLARGQAPPDVKCEQRQGSQTVRDLLRARLEPAAAALVAYDARDGQHLSCTSASDSHEDHLPAAASSAARLLRLCQKLLSAPKR